MSSVQNHVSSDSLVFFNVTGTLYKPANTLADHRWRVYLSDRVKTIITDEQAAESLINKIKNMIVINMPKKVVEEFTPQFISQLQSQNIPVFGITQKRTVTPYTHIFDQITNHHLLCLGINLETTLSYVTVKGEDSPNHSFTYGMIFTNSQPVGPAIVEFLSRLQIQPKTIIMIDNSLECLKNAEKALEYSNVQFYGYRYGRTDATEGDFDPILGNIQFLNYVNNLQEFIPSDELSMRIKRSHPEIDYNTLLDDYVRNSIWLEERLTWLQERA